MARIELEEVVVVDHEAPEPFGPLDLLVEDGSCVAILVERPAAGRAILRAVAGLDRPRAGRILFDGAPVDGLGPRARRVGYGFAPPAVYETGSIGRNLELAAAGSVAVEEISGLFELQPWLQRAASDAPADVRTLVGLARALLRPDASIVLLETPFLGLDPERWPWAAARLGRWRDLARPTLLMTTTNPIEALSLGERVAVLREPRFVQVADPDELVSHPNDLAIAALSGSLGINRIACSMEDDALLITGTEYGLGPSWLAQAQTMPGIIEIGVRPEHIHILLGERDDAMPARLLAREVHPYGIMVTAMLGPQEIRVLAPSVLPEVETLHLVIPPSRLMLFSDGQRIG